jgi:hypothetical protein
MTSRNQREGLYCGKWCSAATKAVKHHRKGQQGHYTLKEVGKYYKWANKGDKYDD